MKKEDKNKNRKKLIKSKSPAWFYFILILIPILFITLLEIGLRTFDYGKDYSTFIKFPEQYPQHLFFNPQQLHKYFSDKSVTPSVIPDAFKEEKDSSTFRIFVLGGSSAAGYPYPTNASFSRQLKRKLGLLYPRTTFEVVNLGVSAVNSVFMADIIEDVLDQSPDLILIYAGHNEYYGAFGATVQHNSLISSRVVLTLKELKIYQLLENSMDWLSKPAKTGSRTLMSEMAGDNTVPLNSEVYQTGLDQFSENMDFIFTKCKDAKVPVIIGTLTSNLMQRPLDYIIDPNSDAVNIYKKGKNKLDDDNASAKKLLMKAKEYDVLRFRAPEDINRIITTKADEYNFEVVDIVSRFNGLSEKPAGFELFSDHLHPNIEGYFKLANIFFDKISKDYLGEYHVNNSASDLADKILKNTFPFTRIDSVFAEIKLKVLLNSYPFTNSSNTNAVLAGYKLINKSDSLAMNIITGRTDWEGAHRQMALACYNNKNYQGFFNEMIALIYDKPFDTYRYRSTIKYLTDAGRNDLAYTVASLQHKAHPSLTTLKELGRLSFELKNFSRALYFFEKASEINKNDRQLLLLKAETHINMGDFTTAKSILDTILKLYPNSPEIIKLMDKLSEKRTGP